MKEVQLIELEHKVLKDVWRDPKTKVVKDLICYKLDEPSSNCFFLTSANLEERDRTELIQFLKTNIEVFTWAPYKMPMIDPNFIRHKLNVLPNARPVKQRGRRSTLEYVDAMIEEVEKLKEASAITESIYPITEIIYPREQNI